MDFGPVPLIKQITNGYFNNFVIIRVIHLVVQQPLLRDFVLGLFYYDGRIICFMKGTYFITIMKLPLPYKHL